MLCVVLICYLPLRAETLSQKDNSNILRNYALYNSYNSIDYIIKKFENHDLVIIGEHHYFKHIPILIQKIIPYLYANGVYNLGIEFGSADYQSKIDKLITSDHFNSDLARSIIFNAAPNFPYREYVDIYRAAWNLNRKLNKEEPKFRIVALPYSPNFRARQEKMTPNAWEKVWFKGNPEEFIANTILHEFILKNKKALIYGGANHLVTRYKTPVWTKEKGFIRFEKRAGNIIFDKVKEKVIFISMHLPWFSRYDNHPIYPAGGIIDTVFKSLTLKDRGFDILGTPFGKIIDTENDRSLGYKNFSLEDFCDGYIYQLPFSEFVPVSLDYGFVSKSNIKNAIENWPNPESRKKITSVKKYYEIMKVNLSEMIGNLK